MNSDNDSKVKLEKFRESKKLAQTILLNGDGIAMNTYSVRRFPTKYLVDRNGIIVKRAYGSRGHDEFEKEIRRLLKAKPAKAGAAGR